MDLRRSLAVGLVLFAIAACSGMPPISGRPLEPGRQSYLACQEAFPRRSWQLFHAIEAQFPGGRRAHFTGVTLLHPEQHRIRAVLMTLEGLVLFDGESADRITVHRAAGPFARPGLAHGLLADTAMVFLPPLAALRHAGTDRDGRPLCHAVLASAGWLDVIGGPEEGWVLNRYDQRRRRTRTAVGAPAPNQPLALAPVIDLRATDLQGYRLTLKLVEAVPLPPDPATPKSDEI